MSLRFEISSGQVYNYDQCPTAAAPPSSRNLDHSSHSMWENNHVFRTLCVTLESSHQHISSKKDTLRDHTRGGRAKTRTKELQWERTEENNPLCYRQKNKWHHSDSNRDLQYLQHQKETASGGGKSSITTVLPFVWDWDMCVIKPGFTGSRSYLTCKRATALSYPWVRGTVTTALQRLAETNGLN